MSLNSIEDSLSFWKSYLYGFEVNKMKGDDICNKMHKEFNGTFSLQI